MNICLARSWDVFSRYVSDECHMATKSLIVSYPTLVFSLLCDIRY